MSALKHIEHGEKKLADVQMTLKKISEIETRLYNSGHVLYLRFEDKRFIIAVFAYPIAGLNGLRVERTGTIKALLKIESEIDELLAMESAAQNEEI